MKNQLRTINFSLVTLAFILTLTSCVKSTSSNASHSETTNKELDPSKKDINAFQVILDSFNVEGTILLFDLEENTFYSNDFEKAEEKFLPASTFKIPHSIIALETGTIENLEEIIPWDGQSKQFKSWEKDLSFEQAFKFSCLPCFQQIAPKIGVDTMQHYLQMIQYPGMKFDHSDLHNFWIKGHSAISPKEQIQFLLKLYDNELAISKRTSQFVKEIMIRKKTEEYIIRGKTGWSFSNVQTENIGWYVGYLENTTQTIFFATRINPKETFEMSDFMKTRIEITDKALQYLNYI